MCGGTWSSDERWRREEREACSSDPKWNTPNERRRELNFTMSEVGEHEVQLVDQNWRMSLLSRKDAWKLREQLGEEGWSQLSRLFDKSLLAELTSEDVSLDKMRRVIDRRDGQVFELMGSCTNPLRSQGSAVVDCILVENRLAGSVALRPAVMKRIHRGYTGQEAILNASNYLWWPQLHKNFINLAEECRSCSQYGKKFIMLDLRKRQNHYLQCQNQVNGLNITIKNF